jgi:50S ribosomal subunit-associated GTPase HflX
VEVWATSLVELQDLASSAGARVVGKALQRSYEPAPATLVGRGKAEDIRATRYQLDFGVHLMVSLPRPV